jgi:3',5'-cyclic AMP phosphodiesterase CpdA
VPTSIIQLTDIHVWDPSSLRPSDLLTKRGTGLVNYRLRRKAEYDVAILRAAVHRAVSERPDLVLVTGDLTNLGLESELAAAAAELRPVLDAGLRTAVIPGNHDAYLPVCVQGQFERTLAEHQRADARDGGPYPYLVTLSDVDVCCFSSAVPTAPFLAHGRIGNEQIAAARRLLTGRPSRRPLVFAVHHHGTRAPHKRFEFHRALRDAGAVRALAHEVGADLLVHGHNHVCHLRRTAAGLIVVGVSSSTTAHDTHDHRRGQIARYRFEGNELAGIEFAHWEPGSGRFSDWREVAIASISAETATEALD